MADRKLSWGILGCASIATRSVIPGIQQSQTGEVLAVASRDEKKATDTASRFGIERAYGSYEAMLSDDDIDVVYIPLPNHLHKTWTIRAAEQGKHILCEKPIALNVEEAMDMVSACDRAGVKLAEAFMYRYHPRYERVREIVKSGEIGHVRGIYSQFTCDATGDGDLVQFYRSMGGGSIYDMGCYPINAARLILGVEPLAATVTALHSPEYDEVDMMATGLVEFPGGIGLSFACALWADYKETLEILGTTGRIEVPSAYVGDARVLVVTNGRVREETFPDVNQYTLEVDSLGRSVLGDQPLQFNPMDSVFNMKVIDACLLSAVQRDRIIIT